MANAFKCDVCGKLYEHYTNCYEEVCNVLLRSRINGITPYGVRSFDLCPDCMDKILDFLQCGEDKVKEV